MCTNNKDAHTRKSDSRVPLALWPSHSTGLCSRPGNRTCRLLPVVPHKWNQGCWPAPSEGRCSSPQNGRSHKVACQISWTSHTALPARGDISDTRSHSSQHDNVCESLRGFLLNEMCIWDIQTLLLSVVVVDVCVGVRALIRWFEAILVCKRVCFSMDPTFRPVQLLFGKFEQMNAHKAASIIGTRGRIKFDTIITNFLWAFKPFYFTIFVLMCLFSTILQLLDDS